MLLHVFRAKNVLLANKDEEGDDMLPITKLADFGAVRADVRHRKLSGQKTSTHNMQSHGITKQVIGTRPYMSYGIAPLPRPSPSRTVKQIPYA